MDGIKAAHHQTLIYNEIVLDYPSGPNAITRVLKCGRWRSMEMAKGEGLNQVPLALMMATSQGMWTFF